MLIFLVATAPDLPPPMPQDPNTAVWVALIGALAPVVYLLANEVLKRIRWGSNTHGTGMLAPAEEVPRAQYETLLERLAELDNRLQRAHEAHEAERERWRQERCSLEDEGDVLRDRLTAEVERRARAEAKLEDR